MKPRAYDQTQRHAVLVTCDRCGTSGYRTHPGHCWTCFPPQPILKRDWSPAPPARDVSGVEMTDP